MSQAIKEINSKIVTLQSELEQLVRSTYPVGTLVRYSEGHWTIDAEVTRQGYGTDLFIVNLRTRKERRVDGSSRWLEVAE